MGPGGAGALRGRSRRLGRLPVATHPCHPERSPRRGRSRRISCLPSCFFRALEILLLRCFAPPLRMTGVYWWRESDAGGRRDPGHGTLSRKRRVAILTTNAPCHPERSARRAWRRRISCLPSRFFRAPEILRLRCFAPPLRMTRVYWWRESGAGGRRSGRCDRMSRCCRGVGLPPDPGVEWTNPVMPWAWPPHRGGPACRKRCG